MIKIYYLYSATGLRESYTVINNTRDSLENSIVVSRERNEPDAIEDALNKLQGKEHVEILSISEMMTSKNGKKFIVLCRKK